jgi:Ca2+-binding RTX toxin-like protein
MLSGVALAINVMGTNGSDELEGTDRADKIRGLGGPDFIAGKGGRADLHANQGNDEVRGADGRDYIVGSYGSDYLYGGGRNDWLKGVDGESDRGNCGSGTDDKAYVDKIDRVNDNCEDVKKYHDNDHKHDDHKYY